jgi:hypothetical protein
MGGSVQRTLVGAGDRIAVHFLLKKHPSRAKHSRYRTIAIKMGAERSGLHANDIVL